MNLAMILLEGNSANGSWSITEMISTAGTLLSTAGTAIMQNPVPAAFVGVSLLCSGIYAFRKLIRVR